MVLFIFVIVLYFSYDLCFLKNVAYEWYFIFVARRDSVTPEQNWDALEIREAVSPDGPSPGGPLPSALMAQVPRYQ